VQLAVADAIAKLGGVASDSVPTLVGLLPTTEPPLQTAVTAALGAMGDRARSALPELEKSLAHENANTRAAALTAFSRIENSNDRKLEVLTAALEDGEAQVRVAAIDELGEMGRAAEPAAEKLYELTEDSPQREQALEVLAGMRIRSVPLLTRALGNSDPYVRRYAAERLGELGKRSTGALPLLRELREKDEEDFVRRAARSALRDIERAD
jgi:HEAT repeat protein